MLCSSVQETDENEKLESKVLTLLEHLDEKPNILACSRFSQQKPGFVRSIRSHVQNPATVYQIEQNSKKLKETDGYKAVYLSPDHTPEERGTRRKLVEELKQKRVSDLDICITYGKERLRSHHYLLFHTYSGLPNKRGPK